MTSPQYAESQHTGEQKGASDPPKESRSDNTALSYSTIPPITSIGSYLRIAKKGNAPVTGPRGGVVLAPG